MKTSAMAVLLAGLFFAGAASADEVDGVEGAKGGKGKAGEGHVPGARWEKRFDKIDANHDGQISKDEFIAFRAAHKQHHRQKDAK
jgi:hypothetical protein